MNPRFLSAILVAVALLAPVCAHAAEESEAEKIVGFLSVVPGQAIAVTGPAAMSLATLLSNRVGPDGFVFVVDNDAAILQNVRHQIEERRLTNTIAIAGSANDLTLPHTVDLVILYNSYHHIPKRRTFFSRLKKYLRTDATVAVIDYYRRPMNVGPPWKERVSSSRAMQEMRSFGFALTARHRISAIKYFLVYKNAKN